MKMQAQLKFSGACGTATGTEVMTL